MWHHFPFEMSFHVVNSPALTLNDELLYNFYKTNYEELNRYLPEGDWRWFAEEKDVDKATYVFYRTLFEAIDNHIPKTYRGSTAKYARRYTEETKKRRG